MARVSYSRIIDRSDFDDIELRSFLSEVAQSDGPAGVGFSPERLSVHNWPAAMAMRTFADHGYLVPRALFAGIGVGVGNISFALAANGCVVFPVDRYLEVTSFSPAAPAGMMIRPEQFSELHYPQGNVIPIHGDARHLSLPTDFFDGVYSTELVARLKTMEEIEASAAEIGRILKPGGIASITVPFLLEGPNGDTDDRTGSLFFTQQLIQRHIVAPSGLELLGEIDTTFTDISFDGRSVHSGLANSLHGQLAYKEDADPNLVCFRDGYLTCHVHIALRKSGVSRPRAGALSKAFQSGADLRRSHSGLSSRYLPS